MKNGTRNVAKDDLHEYDSQVTPIGRILRKTSLDELPQLFNIVEGTMSFVGPRPLIPGETDIHRLRTQAGVYDVRPGVTGWAQVNGRDDLSDDLKVMYDKEYIERCSVGFDLLVLLKTVGVVTTNEGFREGGQVSEETENAELERIA